MLLVDGMQENIGIVSYTHAHLLVRATRERFLPAGGTFGVGLASESHWLQAMLVLITVH